MERISRRGLLHLATATTVVGVARIGLSQQGTGAAAAPKQPPLDGTLVRDFVGAGHGDLDKVKSMLAAEPGLLNATWDWKAGDFESAIGGAGHMGRRDIAEYLLSQGARMDIFVAAMLGELEIVQATLKRFPHLKDSKGPHGIPLKRHAEMGKADSVLEYLKTLD